MKLRVKATLIHLAGSALVAALCGWLVLGVWYPPPMTTLMGGAVLFGLLVAVDVVLGPALTAVVASDKKPRAELMRDLAVILALQLAALGYGLYTMALARPVVLAFEVDLFRLVAAVDIDKADLSRAPEELRELSWLGPRTLAAVKPSGEAEQLRTIELGLSGIPLAALPEYWRDYSAESAKAWAFAAPIDKLLQAHPDQQQAIESLAKAGSVDASSLRVLPLLARRAEGTVLLAPPDARIVGILLVTLP